jgi:hypothetical protein
MSVPALEVRHELQVGWRAVVAAATITLMIYRAVIGAHETSRYTLQVAEYTWFLNSKRYLRNWVLLSAGLGCF